MDLQNVNSHHFLIGSYQFDLAILRGALNFTITCNTSFAKYTATIDPQSIRQNKNIDFFFSTPEDLFAYFLGDCTNNVQLKDGSILFNIQTKLGTAVKNYECVIETIKQEMDPQAVLALKFQRLEKEIDTLKVQNSRLKERVEKQEAEAGEAREEVEKCQRELSRKDEAITNIFKSLKDLEEWKKQKEQLFAMPLPLSRNKFTPDQTNPHTKKFTEIGNRYRKNCGGTWDILISKHPIDRNEVSKYHIKQIKAGSNGSFMYGIGTDAVKGLNRAQDSKEFIGYYENTGFLYDQSESKKGGPKIKDGDTVTVEVDTKKWKIAWLVEGKKEVEITIANELRNKPIYLAIVVFNEESEIEFL